jgi:hypothetical protein
MLNLGKDDEELQKMLEHHLATCPECAAEHAQTEIFHTIVDDYRRPELSPESWVRWGERLDRGLDEIDRERVEARTAFSIRLPWFRRFGMISAAAALFILGMATERLFIPAFNTAQRVTVSNPATLPANNQESLHYINRSRVLLLGMTQTDQAQYAAPSDSTLEIMKKIARDLLAEAPGLKEKLVERQDYRMYALVSELEIILLQITAFDKENSREQLELVQTGVERKALLFRLNLENLAADAGIHGPLPENSNRM